jgi:A/G-specific adenine glycosylase
MLQQTQVSRVQEKLPLFLKKFPTMKKLARASTSDVIRAWQGMGYNNRAVRLNRMAKAIIDTHRGILPDNTDTLQELPGIGPYTAHAVACFAFHKRVPVVDVNIQRVLSRVLWKMRDVSETRSEKEIWRAAANILPRNAYEWNQALMDLGAVICTARRPLCDLCPVKTVCKSKHLSGIMVSNAADDKKQKPEPSHDGIPQRLWRGKIVQTLRTMSDHEAISLQTLGPAIKQSFKQHETKWLTGVIQQLERDGIVETFRRSSTLVLRLAR